MSLWSEPIFTNSPWEPLVVYVTAFVLGAVLFVSLYRDTGGAIGYSNFRDTYQRDGWRAPFSRAMRFAYPVYLLLWIVFLPIHFWFWPNKEEKEALAQFHELVALSDKFEAFVKKDLDYENGAAWMIKRDLVNGAVHQFKREYDASRWYHAAKEQGYSGAISYLKALYQTNDLLRFFGGLFYEASLKFLKQLPQYVDEPVVFNVPIISTLPSSKPIDDYFHVFQRADKAFWEVFSVYTQNWYAAKAAVEARLYPQDSLKYIQRLTDLTLLDSCFTPASTVGVCIPKQLRFEGMWIVAPPGRGKTTLLSRLLMFDLQEVAKGNASVIMMDSKGDLIDHARKLKQFEPHGTLADKLVLIEPTPDLALNPLDLGATAGHRVALLEYVFAALLDSAPTPLQSTLFRSVLLAMEAIPNATFDTFRAFLLDGWKPFAQYIEKMHPDDRIFFEKGEYDSKTYSETKAQLLWRIRDLTTKVPLLRDMFKSPTTKINLGKEMDAGKVIIIDNSAAKLSAGSEFFSRFFLALILAAAQQRATRKDEDKLPCYVYIDECDTVISKDNNAASILHRCRSQKIGLVLAHQEIQQIKSEDVKGALANCAVRLANADDEAPALASRFRVEAADLRALKRGQFMLFMRDYTPKGIAVDVPNSPISGWAKMSDLDFDTIQRKMRDRYCYSASTEPEHPYANPPGVEEDDDSPTSWG